MQMNDYALLIEQFHRGVKTDELAYAALGLAGETGEAVELVKKSFRKGGKLDRVALRDELGDVLYYLTRIANKAGFTLAQIADANVLKLAKRQKLGKEATR
jgi:NTP pyrophosphatase (non-canonical NTP hydrolase)